MDLWCLLYSALNVLKLWIVILCNLILSQNLWNWTVDDFKRPKTAWTPANDFQAEIAIIAYWWMSNQSWDPFKKDYLISNAVQQSRSIYTRGSISEKPWRHIWEKRGEVEPEMSALLMQQMLQCFSAEREVLMRSEKVMKVQTQSRNSLERCLFLNNGFNVIMNYGENHKNWEANLLGSEVTTGKRSNDTQPWYDALYNQNIENRLVQILLVISSNIVMLDSVG